MLFAWEGRELPSSMRHGAAWESHYRGWADRSFRLVGRSLACVAGDVVHIYHGTHANRQYVERYKILHENAFDPGRDLAFDGGTGLLRWSDWAFRRKPKLVPRVGAYFEGRREDE